MGEVARKILTQKKINCFYRDISLNAPMEAMALIRKELKAIGININQQTKTSILVRAVLNGHLCNEDVDLYKKVDERVDRLLIIITKLTEQWVAKIISGKSIRGMLHYNENKVTESKAELLLASGFAADVTKMSLHQKLQRFQHLTMLLEK